MIPRDPRSIAALGHDLVACAAAWCAAFWLRFNLDIPPLYFATMLSNRIVNLTGPTFAVQKRDAEGIDAGHVAQAFEAAFSAFHIDDLVDRISALDGKAPA